LCTHIKALEDELGMALFERTPRGMKRTPGGEALLRRAEAALAASVANHDCSRRTTRVSPTGRGTDSRQAVIQTGE
jgi:DNA-binding transcriptional LysR family regulator